MLVTTLGRQSAILLLSVLCAAGMVYYHLGLFVPRAMEVRSAQGLGGGHSFGADFYPIWLTSRRGLLLRRDPYSAEMTRRIQIGLFGRTLDSGNPGAPAPEGYRAFAYPAFVDLLFWPLALLPFFVVRIALAVILPAARALSIVLWLRTFRLSIGLAALGSLIFLTLSSYAVLEGLFAEQVGLLVGFLLAASLCRARQRETFVLGELVGVDSYQAADDGINRRLSSVVEFPSMARTLAIRGRLSFRDGAARRLFPAGMAALDWGVAARNVWIPGILDTATRVLLARQSDWLAPWSISDCRTCGDCDGSCLVHAARIRRVCGVRGDRQSSVSCYHNHFATGTRGLRPRCAVTRGDPGRPLMARLGSLESRLSRGAGRDCARSFWQWMLAPVVIAMRPVISGPLFFSAVLTLPIRTAGSIPFGVLAVLGLMMRQVQRNTLIAETREQISL
jgi:Glycosyltransferase family 87